MLRLPVPAPLCNSLGVRETCTLRPQTPLQWPVRVLAAMWAWLCSLGGGRPASGASAAAA